MIVLLLRTDKPEAEIGLFDGDKSLGYEKWQAHRELSSTIHNKIAQILKSAGYSWQDLGGIVVYKGPGSFTGLRIGLSLANSLAASLNIPIVGSNGKTWMEDGLKKVGKTKAKKMVFPDYGAPAKTTTPKN